MLLAHYAAPGRLMSATELARAAGYNVFGGANIHYGILGRRVGECLGLMKPPNWTQVLAEGRGEDPASGHFQWEMRPALGRALEQLGWTSVGLDAALLRAAEAELSKDPDYVGGSPAERLALVEARVGQGAYRERVLRIWGRRCALTGADVEAVLIASHAKSWKNCESAAEKRDPYNGLLLAASVDGLFDAGLIAFSDAGELLKSAFIDDTQLAAVGVRPDARVHFSSSRHRRYIRAHRREHGFD